MYKWERRENKRQGELKRMPQDGRSVFEIDRLKRQRAIELERRRKEQERETDK